MDEEDDLFVPLRPLYGRREHRPRGRDRGGSRSQLGARGLSREDIVTTAIAVADAEGADAVTMRRIARDMRVGTMSLYWYVSSKVDLHRLMLERIQAEAQVPAPSGDWRADLRAFAWNMRAALLQHPWALDVVGIGPPSGPNDARNAERLMAAFDGLGLDDAAIICIAMTIGTYAMGAALREVQEIRMQQSLAEATAGMTEAEIGEVVAEFGRRIRQSGRYPHIVRLMDKGIDPDASDTRDERFEFGLDCVLDGIAARLPAGRG